MSTFIPLLLMAALGPLQAVPIKDYHDLLLDMCDSRAGLKCCRASVHAMREEQARLKDEEKGCPNGMHEMSLSCPASLTWCSFRSVDEVRGTKARGDALQ